MRVRLMFAALAALTLACTRPQTAPAPEAPLHVSVTMMEDRPDRASLEAGWAEALRERLTPFGVTRQDGAGPELRVTVKATLARGDVVKQSAGRAFGSSVAGGVDIATEDDNRPKQIVGGALLGSLVGVVVAPVAATATESRALFHNARLGYKPRHLVCTVIYLPPGGGEVPVLETKGWEVIQAMRPMTEAETKAPGALEREEARALAQVVGERLEREHHWAPRAAPTQP